METKFIIQVIIEDGSTPSSVFALADHFFYFTDYAKFLELVCHLPKGVSLHVSVLEHRFNPSISDINILSHD